MALTEVCGFFIHLKQGTLSYQQAVERFKRKLTTKPFAFCSFIRALVKQNKSYQSGLLILIKKAEQQAN